MKNRKNTLIIFSTFLVFFIFLILHIPNPAEYQNEYEEGKRMSGAMKSLNFWTDQRAYPNEDIPESAYYRAYEYSKKTFTKEKLNSSQPWNDIGPKNVGGRTNAITFNPLNPNTVYAGSASGGLWRSFTSGVGANAWEYIKTGFPVLGVNTVAIPESDSNTIYIGTGEVYGYQSSMGGLSIRTTRGSYGIGILKTTNAGQTWTKSLDWSYNQRRGVQVIKIDPTNNNIVYAGTSEGIFKSTDGGTNWGQIQNIIMTTDILINPQNPNIIIAACGNLGSANYGIYRSTNAGADWSKITSDLPTSWAGKVHLDTYKSAPNVVYASIGKGSLTGAGTVLCRSTDSGLNWVTLNTTDYATYQGWFSHFVVVHPYDSSKILCGGIDVWKSTDGGLTLTKKSNWAAWYLNATPPPGGPEGPPNYSHADHHTFAVHPQNPDIVYFGNDGGVFRTTDFGETFSGLNGGYQTTQFYKRFGVGVKDTLVAIGGLQDNASVVYSGSIAWRRVGGGDGSCSAVNSSNSDTMYTSSQYLNISRSTNRGINWSGVSPSSSNQAFVGPFVVSPFNPKIIYAASDKVYKSTIGGGSWAALNNNQVLNGDPILVLEVSYTNADTVFAATAPNTKRSQVFRSTNGGTTWTNITGILPDRYIVDLASDPNNSAIIYCAVSGFGTPHLYKSTDAGNTWTAIGSTLPDVPTSAVIVDALYPMNIYVGNDLGVYVSTDYGNSWSQFSEGFFETALVMDLRISYKDRMLYAATHGNGVFKRRLLDGPTGITENEQLIADFKLEQNYPNPFNSSTIISYELPKTARVKIEILDVLGRLIKIIVNKDHPPGKYSILIDAYNYSTGIYFYRLIADGKPVGTKKMLIIN